MHGSDCRLAQWINAFYNMNASSGFRLMFYQVIWLYRGTTQVKKTTSVHIGAYMIVTNKLSQNAQGEKGERREVKKNQQQNGRKKPQ